MLNYLIVGLLFDLVAGIYFKLFLLDKELIAHFLSCSEQARLSDPHYQRRINSFCERLE
jgi:hypothetical protein